MSCSSSSSFSLRLLVCVFMLCSLSRTCVAFTATAHDCRNSACDNCTIGELHEGECLPVTFLENFWMKATVCTQNSLTTMLYSDANCTNLRVSLFSEWGKCYSVFGPGYQVWYYFTCDGWETIEPPSSSASRVRSSSIGIAAVAAMLVLTVFCFAL